MPLLTHYHYTEHFSSLMADMQFLTVEYTVLTEIIDEVLSE